MEQNGNGEKVFATADLLQDVGQRSYEELFIPGRNFYVVLQSLNGVEIDAWQTSLRQDSPDGTQKRNVKNLRARLVAKALVDPTTKKRMFVKDEQVELLGRQPARDIMVMFDKVLAMNGVTKEGASQIEDDLKSESETPEED